MKIFLHILFLNFLMQPVFSQNNKNNIAYSDLIKYKVDKNKFTFGYLISWQDGTPCFRDYTKQNTQLQLINPVNDSVIYTSPEPKHTGLIIIPQKINIDRKTNLFKIKAQITGGWDGVIPDEFKIYVGHRRDTVSHTTISPNLHGDIYYNGNKVDKTIVIDTVNAFYLTDFKKTIAYRGSKNLKNSEFKEMLFEIDTIIDSKSVLVISLSSTYAEIFEIGKLLLLK